MENELSFILSQSLIKYLLEKDIITEEDFTEINKLNADSFSIFTKDII